jgi:helix-turn-helix protein
MENPELKTEREVVPMLRVKLKTLQTWRALTKGPRFVRVGRRVFYPTAELERFLAENTIETTPSGPTRGAR